MKIVVCFFAIIAYTVALPADVPVEVDIPKITAKNIYLEPVTTVNNEAFALPQGRIIGGTEVAPNSVPYQVAVIINGINFCGGSLISTTTVLTAAHCTVDASFVEVRLGAHHFNQNEATQVRITSSNIINHFLYNIGSFAANDIAVILLPSAVNLDANIQRIALAPANSGTYDRTRAYMTGWGRTSDASEAVSPVLRGVIVDVISNLACGLVYGSAILQSNVCTSGAGTIGACNGDSGGPLVVDGVQIGIVSFGAARCENATPTVFARVSAFRSWIEQHSGV